MKGYRSIIAVALALLALDAAAQAATRAPHVKNSPAKNRSVVQLNANNWSIYTTNYGSCVYPKSGASGGYWGGPSYNYIFGGGLWVGALDTSGTPHVSLGYYPNSGGSEFGPIDPLTGDTTGWASDPKMRVYVSTNPADLAEWPLRDSLGNPIVKSIQDGYAAYSDVNPAFTFTGEQPLGVRVDQFSYAWNVAQLGDMVFFRYTIKNLTDKTLNNVYLGPCFDADIGDESGTVANDRTDFDYTRNLAIQYQTTPEPGWPRVGYFGCRFFESPRNNTGNTVHVVDNQFPHDIPPDSMLGMTAFKIFTIDIDPATDADRYLTMEGYNYKTMAMDAYDENGAVTAGDKRFVMCSGPFDLAPGDSVIVSLGVMAAANRSALLALCDTAQVFYNSMMGVAGDKPRSEAAPVRSLQLANSPNPFRGATEICYQVASPGPVELAVYNGLGQKVRTLVDRQLEPGRYAARWDGRDGAGQHVSAGVYLCRLQAGNFALTRKLVLFR